MRHAWGGGGGVNTCDDFSCIPYWLDLTRRDTLLLLFPLCAPPQTWFVSPLTLPARKLTWWPVFVGCRTPLKFVEPSLIKPNTITTCSHTQHQTKDTTQAPKHFIIIIVLMTNLVTFIHSFACVGILFGLVVFFAPVVVGRG